MLLSFGISVQTTILTDEKVTIERDSGEALFDFLLVFGLCVAACCVYCKNILKKHKTKLKEASRITETTSWFELKKYSISELNEYNGSNAGPVYIALNGKIFDVSKDKKQYDTGGSYKMLAGRDASRAFATLCFDANSLRSDYDDLSDLNDIQKSNLDEWQKIYTEKYNIAGELVKAHTTKTLQNIAMNSIVKNMTISPSDTKAIERLPLPHILKRELRNFFYEHVE